MDRTLVIMGYFQDFTWKYLDGVWVGVHEGNIALVLTLSYHSTISSENRLRLQVYGNTEHYIPYTNTSEIEFIRMLEQVRNSVVLLNNGSWLDSTTCLTWVEESIEDPLLRKKLALLHIESTASYSQYYFLIRTNSYLDGVEFSLKYDYYTQYYTLIRNYTEVDQETIDTASKNLTDWLRRHIEKWIEEQQHESNN